MSEVQTVGAIQKLNSSLSDMMKEQNRSLTKTLAPISQLPDIIKAQTNSITNSMSDNIRAQILIAMAQENGKLSGSEKLVEEELLEIDRISIELETKILKIKNEKSQMLKEIEEDTYKAVEGFDALVMNLTRKSFNENIHLPMKQQVLPTYQMNKTLGMQSSTNRMQWFAKLHADLDRGLNNYADLLDNSSSKAASLAYHGVDLDDEIDIPIICIEYEEDGEQKQSYIMAPRYTQDQESVGQLQWLEDKIDNLSHFGNHAFTQNFDIEAVTPEELLAFSAHTIQKNNEETKEEEKNEN